MNTEVRADAGQLYDAGHGHGPIAPIVLMAVFTLAGLVLMYLANRVIRKRRPHAQSHHKDRFIFYRH